MALRHFQEYLLFNSTVTVFLCLDLLISYRICVVRLGLKKEKKLLKRNTLNEN